MGTFLSMTYIHIYISLNLKKCYVINMGNTGGRILKKLKFASFSPSYPLPLGPGLCADARNSPRPPGRPAGRVPLPRLHAALRAHAVPRRTRRLGRPRGALFGRRLNRNNESINGRISECTALYRLHSTDRTALCLLHPNNDRTPPTALHSFSTALHRPHCTLFPLHFADCSALHRPHSNDDRTLFRLRLECSGCVAVRFSIWSPKPVGTG